MNIYKQQPLTISPSNNPRLVNLEGLLEDWQAEAAAAYAAQTSGNPRGPIAGIEKLDRELGGCFHPGINIVHGTPGVGKTAFCLQVAADSKCPVLYVTCEMSTLELFRRVTARVTNTFLGRLKSGEITPTKSLELARKAICTVPHLAFADATQAYASTEWIRDKALAVQGNAPHLLIVIDSVHSWAESADSTVPEYEALNAHLQSLRKLAASLCCPILAIAERNRASMDKGGLNAGAGTRKIEYGAEAVIDLKAAKEGTRPDARGEVPVTLTLAKNRNGAVGATVNLLWHGALQRFTEA